jgi:hypothetical protein
MFTKNTIQKHLIDSAHSLQLAKNEFLPSFAYAMARG